MNEQGIYAEIHEPRGSFTPTRFFVIGEGLTAGLADFSLAPHAQTSCFPLLMARQMGVEFRQPIFQNPGIGYSPGIQGRPVIAPAITQTTIYDQLPQASFSNLSVPGFTLSDSLQVRPSAPLIWRQDAKRTLANLILDPLSIVHGKQTPLRTQLETVVQQNPTFTIVGLGYCEALEAAIHSSPEQLPNVESFIADYERIVSTLRAAGTYVLLLTIPDPSDTAYFSSLTIAAEILKIEPALLAEVYQLSSDCLISIEGLSEIGFQLISGNLEPLPENIVAKAKDLTEISRQVSRWNQHLLSLGRQYGAAVYDLHGLFRRIATQGVLVGTRTISARYLGGFFSLNGSYPGSTGHAIIANELLHFLNQHYGMAFLPVNAAEIAANDRTANSLPATGPNWSTKYLLSALRSKIAPCPDSLAWESQSHGTGFGRLGVLNGPVSPSMALRPLAIPPNGEQILSLNSDESYVGDAFSMLDCEAPTEAKWASCGEHLFGGLAMIDSHLRGYIQISFAPPVNNITAFTVSFGNGLAGDDSALTAPIFYRFPIQNTRVTAGPGQLTGKLNLVTHEVSDLNFEVVIMNTGLTALAAVNPGFPRQPVNFPGQYGSAWATFKQRADGNLDFTFHGTTFLPLGSGFSASLRLPLPFVGPSMEFATIPCRGTALHPHLHLTTRETDPMPDSRLVPNIPYNSIREFTLYTHDSSFGDTFTLNAPQLGGPATGRSQILGRVQIQFGARCGNSVPIAIFLLNPGGIATELPVTPISQAFPGRLILGPQGFNEVLRFPLRNYALDDVTLLPDPFDIAVGAIDVRSGNVIGNLLCRGFISQDIFFALLRVEPRTPRSTFLFRGPALFQKGVDDQMVFRFAGTVMVPYPEGFLFPEPDLTTGISIGPGSRLDPFLWVHAISNGLTHYSGKHGGAGDVIASTGDHFSYYYDIPSEGANRSPSFYYENHTQQGSFRMHSLAWVSFANSGMSLDGKEEDGECDTVTFTGFGIWSKDNVQVLRQAAVQVSTGATPTYVAIQIDNGSVSNVNTKPPQMESVRP